MYSRLAHRTSVRGLLLVVLLMLIGSADKPTGSMLASAHLRPVPVAPTLLAQLAEGASARVIVDLALPLDLAAQDEQSVAQRQARIAGLQARVSARLVGSHIQAHARFENVPALVLAVDQIGLATLAADPAVAAISADRPLFLSLDQSTPLIGATSAWAAGYTGSGQAVAVLDSGVDGQHPLLSGKVVAEACYSSSFDTITSLCPGGATESTASGSAQPCDASLNGCAHGTHVAGIVAGKQLRVADRYDLAGVAPQAQIIAIQVFSRYLHCGNETGDDCIIAYSSDLIKALERVYALRSDYTIAAVNMSLGGSQGYPTSCDNEIPALTTTISNLRNAGIATVIASGNSGYANAIAFPACISSAISVGATTTSYAGIADEVASFSNSSSLLSLLAPGYAIYSAIPGPGYGYMAGTSMATPHVAGAWAVLKQAQPGASVAEVLTALQSTGKPITAVRSGYPDCTRPRIQLDAALTLLRGQPDPTASPTATASPSPTATASPSPTATASPSPTATASPSPTATASPSPTASPTLTTGDELDIESPSGELGGPGSYFSLVAHGFAPNQLLHILVNDHIVLRLTADAQGIARFVLFFSAATPPGSYTISVQQTTPDAQPAHFASAAIVIHIDRQAALLPCPEDPALPQANALPVVYLPAVVR